MKEQNLSVSEIFFVKFFWFGFEWDMHEAVVPVEIIEISRDGCVYVSIDKQMGIWWPQRYVKKMCRSLNAANLSQARHTPYKYKQILIG